MIPSLMVDLGLVVVMIVVVRVGCADLAWVGMVIGALGDDIGLLGSRNREVQRRVLLILIVVSVVFVTMDVLRSHVVMARVLVVMRLVVLIVVMINGVLSFWLAVILSMVLLILRKCLKAHFMMGSNCLVVNGDSCVMHWS